MNFRNVIPAIVVLVLALCASGIAAVVAGRDVTAAVQRQFAAEAGEVRGAVSEAMRSYEQALRAGAGLFRARPVVTRDEWRTFVTSLQLDDEFPGFQGLGFAAVVPRGDIASFEAQQRETGATGFTVTPAAPRPFVTSIVMLEPDDWRNRRAIGFDMFSEATRRAAMERARDTGRAALTGKVLLRQESDQDIQAGSLLYLPLYADPQPATLEERRERLRGFLYGAFRMEDLLNSVLAAQAPQALQGFRIRVHDPSTPQGGKLYDNRDVSPQAKDGPLSTVLPVEIGGRTWTLSVAAAAPLGGHIDVAKPWMVFLAGATLSLLVAAITASLALGRDRLERSSARLADEVVERKKAQESAEMANNELIHRVKNTLAVVSAIASQTARHSASVEEFGRTFRDRLAALGRIQDMLRPGATSSTGLIRLLREILAPYVAEESGALVLEGPEIVIARNDVVLFSLAINELATNATKYGAWSGSDDGCVEVRWDLPERDGGRMLVITWMERGGPEVTRPAHAGFGSTILHFAVARGMRGKVEVDYAATGIRYTLTIPLRDHAGESAERNARMSAAG